MEWVERVVWGGKVVKMCFIKSTNGNDLECSPLNSYYCAYSWSKWPPKCTCAALLGGRSWAELSTLSKLAPKVVGGCVLVRMSQHSTS
jgi:hypothetical protein